MRIIRFPQLAIGIKVKTGLQPRVWPKGKAVRVRLPDLCQLVGQKAQGYQPTVKIDRRQQEDISIECHDHLQGGENLRVFTACYVTGENAWTFAGQVTVPGSNAQGLGPGRQGRKDKA